MLENKIKSINLDDNGVIDYHEFLNCNMNGNKILSKQNLELLLEYLIKMALVVYLLKK